MKVTTMAVGALTPHEQVLPGRVQGITAAMQAGKRMPPLKVTKAGKVIDGHHRLEAAKRLGLRTVPVEFVDDPEAALAEAVVAAVREFNPCHDPKDGKFAAKGTGSCEGGPETIVGITSARNADDTAHYRPNRTVGGVMRAFADRLAKLPGVTRVHVNPAVGHWDGGHEFSWAVSYNGNGAAKRLMAEVGKTWNQDAILMLRTAKAGETPVHGLEFRMPEASQAVRKAIEKVFVDNKIGGWTWFKDGGQTVLRTFAVPEWGGDNRLIRAVRAKVDKGLRESGVTKRASRILRSYKAEVLYRGDYANVAYGGAS